jgi:phosphoribosyl-ATP pyrophosphohydrolase
MAKSAKKKAPDRSRPRKDNDRPRAKAKKPGKALKASRRSPAPILALPQASLDGPDATVLDRLWSVVLSRRDADPSVSHSARLLSRGSAKVAQKFGEEAVECLIEAVAGNRDALVAESADVLYHLLVVWVASGVRAEEVWAELARREGISGIAEKAARAKAAAIAPGPQTTKIP